jgi:hypothetical protein
LNSIQQLVLASPEDLDLKIEYSALHLFAGNYLEVARINNQILRINPDLLAGLFRTSYLSVILNESKTSDKFLQRVEVLSPNRALDDRAEFCLRTGNTQCHDEYANRYLALLRQSKSQRHADIYEGKYLSYSGDPRKAIALLEPYLRINIDVNGFIYGDIEEIHLALAYEKIGDQSKRDKLLDQIENQIQLSLANGYSPRLIGPALVQISSIKGDAKQAAQRLANALENSYTPRWNELKYFAIYDSVRDHPEFKKQMDNLKTYEENIRDQIIAEGLW